MSELSHKCTADCESWGTCDALAASLILERDALILERDAILREFGECARAWRKDEARLNAEITRLMLQSGPAK